MPANAAQYETYPVPDNAQAIYVIDKDKEQTTASISIMLKPTSSPRNTVARCSVCSTAT